MKKEEEGLLHECGGKRYSFQFGSKLNIFPHKSVLAVLFFNWSNIACDVGDEEECHLIFSPGERRFELIKSHFIQPPPPPMSDGGSGEVRRSHHKWVEGDKWISRPKRRGGLSRSQRRLQFVDFWVVGRKERDFPSRFSLSRWKMSAACWNIKWFFVSNVKSRNETKRSSSHAPRNQPSKRHLMDQKRIGRVPYAANFPNKYFFLPCLTGKQHFLRFALYILVQKINSLLS